MTTKNLVINLLIFSLGLLATSCKDNDIEQEQVPDQAKEQVSPNPDDSIVALGNKVGEVSDVHGTIYYNSAMGLWYIWTHESGSIDSVNIYFPAVLSDDYKAEGKGIVFSGTAYELGESLKAKIPQAGGTEHYTLILSSIASEE